MSILDKILPSRRKITRQLIALVDAINASSLPEPIKAALRTRGPIEGEAPEQAIAYAVSMRDACFAAGNRSEALKSLKERAQTYIVANTSVEKARTEMLTMLAEQSEAIDIVTTIPFDATKHGQDRTRAGWGGAVSKAAEIYARRNAKPEATAANR